MTIFSAGQRLVIAEINENAKNIDVMLRCPSALRSWYAHAEKEQSPIAARVLAERAAK
jgi:hypothetical protein